MTDKQLQKINQEGQQWHKWGIMAQTFVKSGALPEGDNAERVMMKIQAGNEMGMTPVEAIKSFYFVKGVMNIFGSATTRRMTDHGWKISYKDEPNKCTATVKKGDEEYTDSLTFEEAEKSHWTSAGGRLKAGWYEGANRKLKLRYGALSLLIKTYIPSVLGSAVDIKEIAEDTVPVIQGELSTKLNELTGKEVDKINATKTVKELITVCGELKKEKGSDYHKELLKHFNIKRAELEAIK